jgi:hypothetical protein
MLRVTRFSDRSKAAVLLAVGFSACALAATAGIGACITAPPADLPQIPVLGPTIIQDAVQPPRDQILTAFPAEGIVFIVPVRVTDPTIDVQAEVFVDYDPLSDNVAPYGFGQQTIVTPPAIDGGITVVRVPFSWTDSHFERWNFDPNACHTIEIVVADSFDKISAHTAGDSLGADSAVWMYQPNGAGSCFEVDAGDGGFPPDAPLDGLPLTPVGP